jgi:DNA-directed RNA polymerase subunit RPC12/RpoP
MKKPKVLLFDIETTPHVALVWNTYKVDRPAKIIRPSELLCFAWKWKGEKKIHFSGFLSVPQLARKIKQLFNEADAVIAHNGKEFDVKRVNGSMFLERILPPKPPVVIDTLQELNKKVKLHSHKLDSVCQELGIGKKIDTGGIDLWDDVMKGSAAAKAKMKEYNKHDVFLLEGLYDYMRPWMETHPRLSQLYGEYNCPTCESKNIMKNGLRFSNKSIQQRYTCRDCGHPFTEAMSKKVG